MVLGVSIEFQVNLFQHYHIGGHMDAKYYKKPIVFDRKNSDAPFEVGSENYHNFLSREKKLWEGLDGYIQYEEFFEEVLIVENATKIPSKAIEHFLAKEKFAWETLCKKE
jgi:hypothetical protein